MFNVEETQEGDFVYLKEERKMTKNEEVSELSKEQLKQNIAKAKNKLAKLETRVEELATLYSAKFEKPELSVQQTKFVESLKFNDGLELLWEDDGESRVIPRVIVLEKDTFLRSLSSYDISCYILKFTYNGTDDWGDIVEVEGMVLVEGNIRMEELMYMKSMQAPKTKKTIHGLIDIEMQQGTGSKEWD